MKVSIDSPVANLVTEMSEEQFFNLLDVALGYAGKRPEVPVLPALQTGGVVKKSGEFIIPFGDDTKELVKTKEEVISSKDTDTLHLNGVPLPPTNPAFKGFLYLQCEKCKKFKGFMPKNPVSKYRCECGHITPLKDMTRMYVDCKCGQKFRYLTNAVKDCISIDCYSCGAPVDLEYHDKDKIYKTI